MLSSYFSADVGGHSNFMSGVEVHKAFDLVQVGGRGDVVTMLTVL